MKIKMHESESSRCQLENGLAWLVWHPGRTDSLSFLQFKFPEDSGLMHAMCNANFANWHEFLRKYRALCSAAAVAEVCWLAFLSVDGGGTMPTATLLATRGSRAISKKEQRPSHTASIRPGIYSTAELDMNSNTRVSPTLEICPETTNRFLIKLDWHQICHFDCVKGAKVEREAKNSWLVGSQHADIERTKYT